MTINGLRALGITLIISGLLWGVVVIAYVWHAR